MDPADKEKEIGDRPNRKYTDEVKKARWSQAIRPHRKPSTCDCLMRFFSEFNSREDTQSPPKNEGSPIQQMLLLMVLQGVCRNKLSHMVSHFYLVVGCKIEAREEIVAMELEHCHQASSPFPCSFLCFFHGLPSHKLRLWDWSHHNKMTRTAESSVQAKVSFVHWVHWVSKEGDSSWSRGNPQPSVLHSQIQGTYIDGTAKVLDTQHWQQYLIVSFLTQSAGNSQRRFSSFGTNPC